MELAYVNFTNMDAGFGRPYEQADRLVRGHRGTLEVDGAEVVERVAERIFERHNSDDRPDGQLRPSMSVGDVVAIGEVAVSVDRIGWRRVQLDPTDLITDRSWRTITDEPAPAAPTSAAAEIVSAWATPPPVGSALERARRVGAMTGDPLVNWLPLERFCELLSVRDVLGLDPDEFMWMGAGISSTGVAVEVYKHSETRRHLTLDASGHIYRWRGVGLGYELTSLDAALAELLADGRAAAAIPAQWAAAPSAGCQVPPGTPDISL